MKKTLWIFSWLIFPAALSAAEVSRALPGKQISITPDQTTEQTEDTTAITARTATTSQTPIARTAVVQRNIGEIASRTAATATSRDSLKETTRQVGRSARAEAASLNSSAPVRRAGISLRPTTAEVGGRATIVGTTKQTGSNISSENRRLTSRAATTTPDVMTSIEDSNMITESCIAQYTDCMDQFCAVIDSNQKRCSCSSRLSAYSRVESAVKDANTQLNDVAQRIRYVGLSADEIRAIMSATEAELALENTKDTTESRNMLEEIESLIRDPESYASENTSTSLDLDLNFDVDSDVTDIFNLTDSNTSTFSSLRGTDLYNAAQKRCKSILTSCKAKGADVDQIQGRYEIDIDKDCVSYENGLTKMNTTLRSNVRSATQMLQKARLAVLENNNTYDAKGCVGALEQCMQDDMVCGADYEKCLDPTKRYIDENGEVVLGQNISTIRNMMTTFDSSLIDESFVSSAWGMSTMTDCDVSPNDNGKCVVKYLLSKIGMESDISSGLCRPVLDKCQKQTYDSNGKYDPENPIVVSYVQRAMTNIRAAQEKIISDYASGCMADIATCYSKQVTQINSWSSNANVQNVYSVLKGACRNVALTCSYAVFASDPSIDGCPIEQLVDYTSETDTETERQSVCIENISDIFYQSMLCPDYSTWVPAVSGVITTIGSLYTEIGASSPSRIYINERCVCQTGYGIESGQCTQCPTGFEFNAVCEFADESVGCPMVGCGCPATTPFWNIGTETCVAICPSGTHTNTNNNVCQECPTSMPYWYSSENYCVESCPSWTITNSTTYTCDD